MNMKKAFLYMMFMAFGAVSCNEAMIEEQVGYGELSLSLTGDPAVDVITRTRSVELSADEAADYNIWVCDAESNAFVVPSQQFTSSISVPAGSYTVWAESCTEKAAENGQGCVRYLGNSGSNAVEVTAGGSTDVEVDCSVANALVEIVFDSSLSGRIQGKLTVTLTRSQSGNMSARTVTLEGNYVADANVKEVWFNSDSNVTYSVSGKLTDGTDVAGSGTLEALAAKSYTQLVIKVNSDGTLKLSSEVETLVTETVEDKPFNPYQSQNN